MLLHFFGALAGAAVCLAVLRALDRIELRRVRANMSRWRAEAREFERRARERNAMTSHNAPMHRLVIEAGAGLAWRAEYSHSQQMVTP